MIFRIEVFQGGKWTSIPEKSRKIQREGTVITVQVETAPVQTEKFRVVFGKQDKVLISPCELRAFK
ncbi:hypothetical protein SDC9_211329 [bioreactor metagenome]|uniref:Uncharacterized protein n=1 Tax=bioreactor metagenome TaxID=1076179 RepID=A0A645JIQ5_9ZZZZ